MVAFRRQQEEDVAALLDAVCQHMQRWRLRRLMRAWQQHSARCARGRAALQRMAAQADRRMASHALGAWHAHLAHRRERLGSLAVLVAGRQRQRAQQAVFDAWRQQTDDRCGGRLQQRHAAQVLARLRLRQVLLAWLDWRHERVDRRRRWEAAIAHVRQRGNVLRLDASFAAWLEHVAEQREQRAIFFRSVLGGGWGGWVGGCTREGGERGTAGGGSCTHRRAAPSIARMAHEGECWRWPSNIKCPARPTCCSHPAVALPAVRSSIWRCAR